MRKFFTTAAVLASFAAALVPATASARDHGRYDNNYRDDRGNRHDNRGYNNRRYDDRGYRSRGSYRQDGYNGRDRRGYAYGGQNYRCRNNNGTTGTILGAIAGGLVGNQVAGRGDRTLGTVLGGGAGALAGRAIDKSGNRC